MGFHSLEVELTSTPDTEHYLVPPFAVHQLPLPALVSGEVNLFGLSFSSLRRYTVSPPLGPSSIFYHFQIPKIDRRGGYSYFPHMGRLA